MTEQHECGWAFSIYFPHIYCTVAGCNETMAVADAEARLNEYETLKKATEKLSAEIARLRGCDECWTGKSCGKDCHMQDIVDILEGKS